MKLIIGVLMMASFMLLSNCSTGQQGNANKSKTEITRSQIAEKYKWNLQDLYKDEAAWQAAKKEVEGMIPKFMTYKGKLGRSANTLYNCLEFSSNVWKEYMRLSSYAGKLSDQDTRESGPMAMTQEISQLGTKLGAASSFIEPEILAISSSRIKSFMKQQPGLKVYAHYIANIQRRKAHTLTSAEEKIIADAGIMSDTPYDVYGIFKNADMPRPEVAVTSGKKVRLDDAAYTLYRADANRDLRKEVFEQFFGAYKNYERTFGTELYGEVKKDMFYKNVRKYNSCLESALDGPNVPVSVYHNLITSIHENLPVLHRYLKLRKKMMGLKELHYYDMYPSLVKKADMTYTVEEAEELVKKGLAPLGPDYVAVLDEAFNNRWIDIYPNTGKRSGAYSSGGAYDVHPYILLNFNGKYDDVSTMAHELGHTMHSYFSNKNQAFINSHYPIFLAEVASITNETLLIDFVLKHTDDPQKRLSLLGNQLETFRTTLFRQTQFAEFELKIHEMAEKGEALTGEKLSKVYLDILKTYYGADQDVTNIEDLYSIEWAYIPHFYYNFYVFQYATSLCAAATVAEKILKEGPAMRDKYIKNFLSAGSSDYPIPILKSIGVDMTTNQPFDMALQKMNKIMDEIEQILNKQK